MPKAIKKSNPKNYFAKNLKYLRESRGIEQKQMAEDLNIKQPTLSCWESLRSEPDLDTLVKIAKYFKISDNMVTDDLTIVKPDELKDLFLKNLSILTDEDREDIERIIMRRFNKSN